MTRKHFEALASAGWRRAMDKPTQFAKHNIHLWKDDTGWHYDGPAGCGPRHVRRSGRGPYWVGPVSPQFVGALRRAIMRMEGNNHA